MGNKKENEKVERFYNWCFLCYENPVELLKDKPFKVCVSPCHDKDFDEDGNLKKPHWHCIVHYDNAVSVNRVVKDFMNIGANCHYLGVSSKTAYEEYLTHSDGQSVDDENKFEYDKKEIVCLGGYTLGFSEKTSREESNLSLYDCFIDYVSQISVDSDGETSVSLLGFSGYIRNKKPELMYYLMKNSYFIINLIKEFTK